MKLSASKPRLRFSLRAMLVAMTLFAVWCAYSVSWIQKRRAVIQSGSVSVSESHDSFHRPPAPGLLWLFGEEGYQLIGGIGIKSRVEAERVHALFPESVIVWMSDSETHFLP